MPLPIQMDQLCHISQIFKTGEEIKYQPCLDTEWFNYFEESINNSYQDWIHKTLTSHLTSKQLLQQEDFKDWLEVEFKQRDTHKSDKMFGEPCPCQQM